MSKAGESQDEVVNLRGGSLSFDAFARVHEDERWPIVEQVLESATFRRSPRLKEFLRFVAEQTLARQAERLTESEIGRLVFQRGDDYIPTDDSIVRSSARQLRIKLREYFETEGRQSPWIIEIPKGAYAVHFRENESAARELPSSDGEIHTPPGLSPLASPAISLRPLPPRARLSPGRLAISLGSALLLASLALNLWLSRTTPQTSPSLAPAQLSFLGSLVMQAPRATQFIMDDYAFVILANAASHRATLEDYANRSYTNREFLPTHDPAFLKLWNLLSTRYLVSFGAAAAAEDALRAVPQQQKLVIRHARNVAPREFKQGNFILFGSPPNNPWAELFEGKLNFQKSPAGFENRHPLPGEQAVYSPQKSLMVNSGIGYARLAYLPNPPGEGFVLLLTGINMVTSEAAAEFATDPARVAELLKITGAPSLTKLPHFEALLQTSAVDTTPKDVRVIAYRRID
jgi:hypothetical protein